MQLWSFHSPARTVITENVRHMITRMNSASLLSPPPLSPSPRYPPMVLPASHCRFQVSCRSRHPGKGHEPYQQGTYISPLFHSLLSLLPSLFFLLPPLCSSPSFLLPLFSSPLPPFCFPSFLPFPTLSFLVPVLFPLRPLSPSPSFLSPSPSFLSPLSLLSFPPPLLFLISLLPLLLLSPPLLSP